MRAAGVGIVESVGARDPSCSSTGEDEPYNGPPAVSSAWENGTETSPREATRWPSAGQAGGDLQNFHHRDGARDGVVRALRHVGAPRLAIAAWVCYIVIQILMGDCWNLGLAH